MSMEVDRETIYIIYIQRYFYSVFSFQGTDFQFSSTEKGPRILISRPTQTTTDEPQSTSSFLNIEPLPVEVPSKDAETDKEDKEEVSKGKIILLY